MLLYGFVCGFEGLVSEYFLGGDSPDGSYLAEGFHVEVFLVAEDDVSVGFSLYVLSCEVHEVFEAEFGQSLVGYLGGIVVDAESQGVHVGVEDAELGGSCGG